jgi:anthranilate phosphoribosyltransferase
LELVMQSHRKELPPEQRVSLAQMGAFFAAMTLRRRFHGPGAWSEGERRAFDKVRSQLLDGLPDAVVALIEPATDRSCSDSDVLAAAVQRIVLGEHLGTVETRAALDVVLSGHAHPALAAAMLIGQRMNIETHDESLAYLRAAAPPCPIIELSSLMHVGQPYNGSVRSFRPALFAAAVSAALGTPTLLHGVHRMPPKDGITEEQMIRALGQQDNLDEDLARTTLLDGAIGFAFVDREQLKPGTSSLMTLRTHIKKRPVFATTEKLQLMLRASGRNHMIGGYFHPGYDAKMLALMRDHNLDTEIVLKGREGSTDPSLRSGRRDDAHAMNQCHVRRRLGDKWQPLSLRIDPASLGITRWPKAPPPQHAEEAGALGCRALRGEHGPARDSIALSAATKHHIVTQTMSLESSLRAAYGVIDNGNAWDRMQRYLAASARLITTQ